MRTKRLVSTLLVISMVAPLLFGSAAAASTEPCCPACPPPVETPANEPCHGSLLLVCCDDVATAPTAANAQLDPPSTHALVSAPVAIEHPAFAPSAPSPADLAWKTSALQRSVILRI